VNYLYVLELNERDDSVPEEMFLSLPGDKRTRLLRYRHQIDRKIGACSELLLRCLVCARLGRRYKELDICLDGNGKPYLADRALEFNVSHTRYAVAVALSDAPVGVDIERVREIGFSVADSVFSDGELALLNNAPGDRTACFFEIWTKKEARLKRSGDGLRGLRACDVTRAVPGEELITMRSGQYILSVCSAEKYDSGSLIQIREEELHDLWRSYAF
jgi:4'-phosphopantetheinyl transferase